MQAILQLSYIVPITEQASFSTFSTFFPFREFAINILFFVSYFLYQQLDEYNKWPVKYSFKGVKAVVQKKVRKICDGIEITVEPYFKKRTTI